MLGDMIQLSIRQIRQMVGTNTRSLVVLSTCTSTVYLY